MHSCIYFGFIGLFMVTATLEVDHQMPDTLKFLHGGTYQAFAAIGDAVGVVFLIGIVWALGRRYWQRPYRIRIKTKPEDAMILGTFLVLGLTGFFVEAVRIARRRTAGVREAVVVYPLSSLVSGWSAGVVE